MFQNTASRQSRSYIFISDEKTFQALKVTTISDTKSLQNSTGKTSCLKNQHTKYVQKKAQNRAKMIKSAENCTERQKNIKKLRERTKNQHSCEKLAHGARPLWPPFFISDHYITIYLHSIMPKSDGTKIFTTSPISLPEIIKAHCTTRPAVMRSGARFPWDGEMEKDGSRGSTTCVNFSELC